MATNPLGESISREARMTLRQGSQNEPSRPQFVQIPAGHVFFDEDSDYIIMHCVANGVPQPQVAWSFNDQPLRDNTERVHIYDNGTLVIHNPIEEDEGNYKCEATNYLGSISTVANYKINGETILNFIIVDERGLIFLSKQKPQKNLSKTFSSLSCSFLSLLPIFLFI